ncbi:hypothetical protein Hjap01_02113 [Haloarcula japonica]
MIPPSGRAEQATDGGIETKSQRRGTNQTLLLGYA